jgi:hypothetical protein
VPSLESRRIPGDRSLATPAFVDGLVFLGGEFGSYDFHALDALRAERARLDQKLK